MALGKSLGGGVPVSTLMAQKNVDCFEPRDQGDTFNGNPLIYLQTRLNLKLLRLQLFQR